MPSAPSFAQTAHDTLRALEVKAKTFPDTRGYRPDDPAHNDPDYYAISTLRRNGGVTKAEFSTMLTRGPAPVFHVDSLAHKAITEAVHAGLVHRVGHGPSTRYRTAEHVMELEAADRRASDDALALGRKAEALGLRVTYRHAGGYCESDNHAAAMMRADDGRLVRKVSLAMPLSEVVDLLQSHGH